jgi:L-amino acid N-acyltransferase YncA
VDARIAAARPEHLVEVAAIYADAARTNVSTFDLDGAPLQYWQDKLASPGPGDHFIVAIAAGTSGDAEVGAAVDAAPADAAPVDAAPVATAPVDSASVGVAALESVAAPVDVTAADADTAVQAVLGFAYSGWFRPRPAYGRTRETSIYLHRGARGQGLGRALYQDLLDRLRGDGMHLAVAVVAQPNPASVALHEALGFELVGTFSEIGEKFGRYVDTRWYQLRLD